MESIYAKYKCGGQSKIKFKTTLTDTSIQIIITSNVDDRKTKKSG